MTEGLMRRVCGRVGEAYALRPELKVAFNLTAAHFADDRIVAGLRAIVDRSQCGTRSACGTVASPSQASLRAAGLEFTRG